MAASEAPFEIQFDARLHVVASMKRLSAQDMRAHRLIEGAVADLSATQRTPRAQGIGKGIHKRATASLLLSVALQTADT